MVRLLCCPRHDFSAKAALLRFSANGALSGARAHDDRRLVDWRLMLNGSAVPDECVDAAAGADAGAGAGAAAGAGVQFKAGEPVKPTRVPGG